MSGIQIIPKTMTAERLLEIKDRWSDGPSAGVIKELLAHIGSLQADRYPEAMRLLARAKPEIFLGSRGNPELVKEIEAVLAKHAAVPPADAQADDRPPAPPRGGGSEWA
jgi:hypothetical protein